MFDITKEDLRDILRHVDDATLQLPDFQRDYVWADDDLRSLLASVAKGFPVGALLTLETGGEVRFKPRPLEGVQANGVGPAELLLDGQQRMTSLYQATYCQAPVRTQTPRGKEIQRFYYLDMRRAVDAPGDLEDAIVGVPADRIIRTNFGRDIELDLSTRSHEFEHHMFPLNRTFDARDWFYDWRDHWRDRDEDVHDLERSFVRDVLDRIERYKMPIIRLDKRNGREAICLVFEKVNVGGKKLDAFELVTAIYAADNFNLREDWNGSQEPARPGRLARIIGSRNRCDVLTQVEKTDFLQACTLLHTRGVRLARAREGKTGKELPQVSCKRESLLALPLDAYRRYADAVEAGFMETGRFLNELKIIWHKDIPYPPQLVALASAFAVLGDLAESAAARRKLELWFWSVTLGELYGSSTESRLARDVPELVDWIAEGGGRPRSLEEAIFQEERFRSLRTRVSAAYKGIHALLMQRSCRDFISGKPAELMTFFDDRIDIHHIFPQAWCKRQGLDRKVFDSIVNKSPLSKRSNQKIGGRAPSEYLRRIEAEQGISEDELDEILRTHLIEPEHLRNDDFEAFFAARLAALSDLVANAMEKPVVQESGANEPEQEAEPAEPELDAEYAEAM